MGMGQLYRFYLTYGSTTVETIPTNWDGMELQAKRDDHIVGREISLEFEFIGQAKDLLILANQTEGHTALVSIQIDKRMNDWTYTTFKTMKADMMTYKEYQTFVSIGFYELSLREQVEDKADTVFNIALDEGYFINYTGIDRIRENMFSAIEGHPKAVNNTSSVYIPRAFRTVSQYTQAITWSDDDYATTYDCMKFKVIESRPLSIKIKLDISMKTNMVLGTPKWARIGFFKISSAGTVTQIWCLRDDGTRSSGTQEILVDFTSHNSSYFGGRESWWTVDEHTYTVENPTVGDTYYIGYKADTSNSIISNECTGTNYSYLDVYETAQSPYVDRAIPSLHHDKIIERILSKMGIKNADGTDRTVGNGIVYNLPTEANADFLLAFTSCDGLLQTANATMNVSLNQAMSLVHMRYGAILTYTETDVIVDLISNQYDSSEEVVIEPINDLVINAQDSLIYGTVEVGYKTDEKDATNVKNEVLCKNTFSIPSGKGDAYSITTDTIVSPYCIESRIEALLADSTNTNSTDDTIFCFAVYPISDIEVVNGYYYNYKFWTTSGHTVEIPPVSGKYYFDLATSNYYLYILSSAYAKIGTTRTMTFLDKRHTITNGNVSASYYNIPLTPMRCILAHAPIIGASCHGGLKSITLASTERTAECTSKMSYESNYVQENATSSELATLLSNPYYLPYTGEFKANWKIESLSALKNNVLYSAVEQKSGKSVKGYINILTLQLSKVESQQINLVLNEI